MTRFLVRLIVYSAAVFTCLYLAESYLHSSRFAYPGFWKIQLFMIAVSVISYAGLENAGLKGHQFFIRQFMATTGLKLFLYMVVMVGFAMINRAEAVGFIVHFFILYLAHSVFEIAYIYKRLSAR